MFKNGFDISAFNGIDFNLYGAFRKVGKIELLRV
jgi:hypothetical protein